jgi:hypothetical protein
MFDTDQELRDVQRELAEEIERLQVALLLGNEDTDAALGPRLRELRHHQRIIDAMLEARPVLDLLDWRTGCDSFDAEDLDVRAPTMDSRAG